MPLQSLLPIAQQAWPYITKAGQWIAGNPYAREIALRSGVGVGGYLGGKLLGGGETERYQKQLQEQMRLIQEQIRSPGTTPAGQAIQRTIKQQGKQAQQALAASAAQRGQTGTSPARASQMQQLGREAEQRAGAMAQLSTAAQADYTNLLSAQERLAAEERSAIGDILRFIGKGVAEVATRKLIMEALKGANAGTSTTNILPPGPASSVIPDYTVGGMYEQRQQDRLNTLRGLRSGIQPPTIDAVTGAPQVEIPYETPRDIATELPRGIPTFEPTRPEDVRYPSPLIQRQPSPTMPAYIPPVTEQMPEVQEEYARSYITALEQMPETLRAPATISPQAQILPPVTQQPVVSPTGTEGITAETLRTTLPARFYERITQLQQQYYNGEFDVNWYKQRLQVLQGEYGVSNEQMNEAIQYAKDSYWQRRGRMLRTGR